MTNDVDVIGGDPRLQLTSLLVTAPAALMTVAEAKAHARITHTGEDTLVADWVKAAVWQVEQDTGLCLLTQTWDITGDVFPPGRTPLALTKGPLQSVTYVKYYDRDATLQTMATTDYLVDTVSLPPRIGLATAAIWPSNLLEFHAVIMRVVVGWATAATIPANLLQAVRLVLTTLGENRAVEEFTDKERTLYEWLIGGHRLHSFG